MKMKEFAKEIGLTKRGVAIGSMSTIAGIGVSVLIDDVIAACVPVHLSLVGKGIRKAGSLALGALADAGINKLVTEYVDAYYEGKEAVARMEPEEA